MAGTRVLVVLVGGLVAPLAGGSGGGGDTGRTQPTGPAVGLAWSGGGLTGFFASMCAQTALSEISAAGEGYNREDYTVAVNSGGTLGTMLLATAPAGRLRL